MVAGDILSGESADNAVLTFQPAAGVEVMLTYLDTSADTNAFSLYNGTKALVWTPSGGNFISHRPWNVKIGITNTIYYNEVARGAGNRTAYSGVQTK